MPLLAIDSAGRGCSAALGEGEGATFEVTATRALEGRHGQADHAIELVDRLLDEAGVAYDALDLIVVNVGPGSFTGVRTAVAAARGLALAAGLPVLPLTGFDVLVAALPVRPGVDTLAALDARRGEVYVQRFDDARRPVAAPAALAPEVAAAALPRRIRLAGDGAPLIRDALPAGTEVEMAPAAIDAGALARAAAEYLAGGASPIAGSEIRPLYLRAPDARPQGPRRSAVRA